MLRNYGVSGLQKHIREGVRLAQKFEALIKADDRFEIPAMRHLGRLASVFIFVPNFLCCFLGMVVFRIRGENELTEKVIEYKRFIPIKQLNNLYLIICC